MDYSNSSKDEFSDIGSGSDVESEEEVESEVNVSLVSSGNEGENDEEMEVDDEEEANEEILRSKNGMEWNGLSTHHIFETPVCKEHSYIVCRNCMDVVEKEEDK
uniref:Uncharacterized protein n=1 Tax=Acrobeloides nanus TaxID=290746 RepID=A0A914EF31_9BILA